MSETGLHVDKAGTLGKPKKQSPKTIQAWANARESFARTICGSVILVLLIISYILTLFCKPEHANNVLVVVGSGLGFLLGSREKPSNDGV